mmetsp:Transcript_33496/g.77842  ORF Transcript_33496/g.77842 Transcript_33496/m.77842 type:complete len:244 (+) Transcript_33496:853-1584(+)
MFVLESLLQLPSQAVAFFTKSLELQREFGRLQGLFVRPSLRSLRKFTGLLLSLLQRIQLPLTRLLQLGELPLRTLLLLPEHLTFSRRLVQLLQHCDPVRNPLGLRPNGLFTRVAELASQGLCGLSPWSSGRSPRRHHAARIKPANVDTAWPRWRQGESNEEEADKHRCSPAANVIVDAHQAEAHEQGKSSAFQHPLEWRPHTDSCTSLLAQEEQGVCLSRHETAPPASGQRAATRKSLIQQAT